MLLEKTNIQKKLFQEKEKENQAQQLIAEVYKLLSEDEDIRKRISATLSSKNNSSSNSFKFDLLDTKEIYHISHIKKIAINYRLRFLDVRYFKGPLPSEVISKIKGLEKLHNTELKGFKILAPSKLFILEDRDDPVLFAPIGNDYYYLIHKWGTDLHPLRKLMMWPFKNFPNLLVTIISCSYLLTVVIPSGLFTKNLTTPEFWILFFFMFKTTAFICLYYGVAKGKNFNSSIWNSKYIKP
ncbi:hypothetical protein SAMN04487911_11010 [Arenibacter nanhaiticus]|uniref:Uncharacterized protein n=1 Tax=Arenibacter nanhaiticus TaxID=558155 RepID=A0A1M6G3I2_9FLAO|nr:hypothetical protein [Arenibacter nanhaiticus]SHJ04402.1 hypothetical protein SAMN04487911_11010 [Arenibacter nanhaiticus]